MHSRGIMVICLLLSSPWLTLGGRDRVLAGILVFPRIYWICHGQATVLFGPMRTLAFSGFSGFSGIGDLGQARMSWSGYHVVRSNEDFGILGILGVLWDSGFLGEQRLHKSM